MNARFTALLASALCLLPAACNHVRHTAPLTYAGQDGRNTIAALRAEIAEQGYRPICADDKFCKFAVSDDIWVHYKAKSHRVVLVVDVMDGKEMAPAKVEALRAEGEKVGRAIWDAAVDDAVAYETEQAELAARRAEEDAAREAAEERERERLAAMAPPPSGMDRMNRDRPAAKAENHARCCINGAYYACPDSASLNKCGGETSACMMTCMSSSDMSCPDRCLEQYPPDPSGCQREPARDGQCKG